MQFESAPTFDPAGLRARSNAFDPHSKQGSCENGVDPDSKEGSKRRGGSKKMMLAMRKKRERAETNALWALLESVTPTTMETNAPQQGNRCQELRSGRTKQQLLEDALVVLRQAAKCSGGWLRQSLEKEDCGLGLVQFELNTGKIVHASRGFKEAASWCLDGKIVDQNITIFLHPADQAKMKSVLIGIADSRKCSGVSIPLRFLRRPAGHGIRAPHWLLVRGQTR